MSAMAGKKRRKQTSLGGVFDPASDMPRWYCRRIAGPGAWPRRYVCVVCHQAGLKKEIINAKGVSKVADQTGKYHTHNGGAEAKAAHAAADKWSPEEQETAWTNYDVEVEAAAARREAKATAAAAEAVERAADPPSAVPMQLAVLANGSTGLVPAPAAAPGHVSPARQLIEAMCALGHLRLDADELLGAAAAGRAIDEWHAAEAAPGSPAN